MISDIIDIVTSLPSQHVIYGMISTVLCIAVAWVYGKCSQKIRLTILQAIGYLVIFNEVVFQIYEDGSTAGRIQRNKGQYVVGYNMSVESSILPGAYLIYMQEAGAKDFNIGVMTDNQVLDLFS